MAAHLLGVGFVIPPESTRDGRLESIQPAGDVFAALRLAPFGSGIHG